MAARQEEVLMRTVLRAFSLADAERLLVLRQAQEDEEQRDVDDSAARIENLMQGPQPAAGGEAAAGVGCGASAGAPVAGWIDPDLLEIKFQDCVCALCFGVMVEPTSGCPEGHSCCRICFVKALREKKACPTCRHPADGLKLVRSRPLEGMISQLRMRCQHAAGGGQGNGEAGPSEAKPATPAPASSATYKELRTELRQRGLDSTGGKPELVARLEEDRKKDAGCRWRGSVAEVAAHLGGECEWEPVKCPNHGCTETRLPRDLLDHQATCGSLLVKCGRCAQELKSRLLAEHEGSCPEAVIGCPNEGCSRQTQRCWMDQHRAKCKFEEVSCLCPGCDARLLRKGMDAHVEATHLGSPAQLQSLAVKLLQSAWSQNAAHATTLRQVAILTASSESEHFHASPSPSSWVFNWRAGFGTGTFNSETHNFGGGVAGKCILTSSSNPEHSRFIGYKIVGIDKCKVHATFSILDKHDKTLRRVHVVGSSTAPAESDFTNALYKGRQFTPTAEEKVQSERADGSIRLRAVVRLFPDLAA